MACYACAWYAQLCGGWNPVRLLLLVQLAFVFLGSSLAIAKSDSAYYNYEALPSSQHLTEDQVTHEFNTNELTGAVFSRRRRDAEENSRLELQNEIERNNGIANNMTKIRSATHRYYNSTIFNDEKIVQTYWVDMDNNLNRRVTDPLDQIDEGKTMIKLKFAFPFYGLKIRKIGIGTGYLYTGEEIREKSEHEKWTQYIAPLIANFSTNLLSDSLVTYADNGTALTVEWKALTLLKHPEVGNLTFQATLYDNGDIVFVYSKLPLTMQVVNDTSGWDDEHLTDPVRIGVSDSHVYKHWFLGLQVTSLEYDVLNFNVEDISSGSVIYLKPLPTCVEMNNCNDCLSKVPHFDCKWCPALQRCDTGESRFAQPWLENGCRTTNITKLNECSATPNNVTVPSKDEISNNENHLPTSSPSDSSVNTIVPQSNVTKFAEDSHQYYNSTIANDEKIANHFWVNMDDNSDSHVVKFINGKNTPTFNLTLKFDFPFYGFKIRNITIVQAGFLSTGPYVHKLLNRTQYIAPLMANFSSSLSKNSRISYADNGTALTVEWKDVFLQNNPGVGPFTFQVTIHENGDIIYVYRKIPRVKMSTLEENSEPIRVGVSDAHMTNRTMFYVPRLSIYEYHRIKFNFEEIGYGTYIYLKALPTCLMMNNCHDCLTKVSHIKCRWCPALQRCDSGVSRLKQEWEEHQCDRSRIWEENRCATSQLTSTLSDFDVTSATQPSVHKQDSHTNDPKVSSSRKRRFIPKEQEPAATHDPLSDTPEIKAAAASVTLIYSTNKVTAVSSTMNPAEKSPHLADANSTVKIDTPKTSKNKTVVVSNPMNPVTGQPAEKSDDLVYAVPRVHVWANQTRWENATHQPDVTNPEKSDPPKPNPPTMSSEEKPIVNGTPDAKSSNTTSTDKVVVSTANSTDSDLGDISISKFSDVTNNTLAQNNITKTEEDTHQYYNSTFFSDENIAKSYWVDMDNHPDRLVNDLLSQSHRRAATVKLKFDFPFYGHKVRNITIATGGFLYTGEYVHSWLAATQYIAPLMANFDTRLSRSSWVKYADNGTAFTVEWEEVVLQDRPEAGGFTFQATLHENGNIVFVYSKIPLTVEAIEDTAHPVKVGLSDAYIMDRTIFFVRRKTIYEYHRVNFNHQEIRNWTVIYLKALPTCLELTNCNDCLTKVPEFECKWCPELQQCSTGTFRFRQDWLEKGCEQKNIKEQNSCPATQTSYTEHLDNGDHPGHARNDAGLSASVDQNSIRAKGASPSILEHPGSNMNMGVSGIIGILVVVTLIAGLVAWAGYAYRNPHSASGQMLIRYRPSQWSWRRGEARYTAATIHM